MFGDNVFYTESEIMVCASLVGWLTDNVCTDGTLEFIFDIPPNRLFAKNCPYKHFEVTI